MSLRLVLICLALFVVVFAPEQTTAAPHELAEVLVDHGVHVAPVQSADEADPKQRTLFLLLPLLFPDTFYFS